ncbi:MAG: PEP-CTERM sorting domain-containing protein [Bryobacteraceae bacterium]
MRLLTLLSFALAFAASAHGTEIPVNDPETSAIEAPPLEKQDPDMTPVPEPPTMLFFATGGAMLAFGWRRRAKR